MINVFILMGDLKLLILCNNLVGYILELNSYFVVFDG